MTTQSKLNLKWGIRLYKQSTEKTQNILKMMIVKHMKTLIKKTIEIKANPFNKPQFIFARYFLFRSIFFFSIHYSLSIQRESRAPRMWLNQLASLKTKTNVNIFFRSYSKIESYCIIFIKACLEQTQNIPDKTSQHLNTSINLTK